MVPISPPERRLALATPTTETPDETLIKSWQRSLRARNFSQHTQVNYGVGLAQWLAYLVGRGKTLGSAGRRDIEEWLDTILNEKSAQTARTRFIAVQQFYKWMADEGELPASPAEKVRTPICPEKDRPVPTAEQVGALLRVCKGTSFLDRRDMALLSLLVDTGMRAGECLGLKLEDIDLDNQVAYVLGKGRRARPVPYGDDSAVALDRYLRTRSQHRLHELPEVWLGQRGGLKASSLREVVDRRAEMAGLPHLHPHLFRHGFAHHWLMQGRSADDLMRILGWKSQAMLLHYARATAQERAIAAYRRGGSPLRGQ